MKGSIHIRKDANDAWWFVLWYDTKHKKSFKISRYLDGSRMYQTHKNKRHDFGYRQAEKLLAQMQADVERGVFRIERFTGIQRSDVEKFYREWLEEFIAPRRKPGTVKPYRIYINKWLAPWFNENGIQLHEIDAHTLIKLTNHLKHQNLSSKYVWNIMNALRSMMDYAYRVKGLPVPPFPKKEEYGIIRKKPKWLSKKEFWAVIEAIPEDHRPIFLWLYWHYRRPGEACVLRKTDYDPINQAFYIRRTLSAREEVTTTKTSAEHYIPCRQAFLKMAWRLVNQNTESPYLFTNPRARRKSKRYTLESLRNIWYTASDKAKVPRKWVYQSTKHTSCTHYIEDGGTIDELQMLTDHRRRDSVEVYADITLDRKRTLMERDGKIIDYKKQKLRK